MKPETDNTSETAKNRARRYETASAFALDVERHLASEPVVATPPSRAYQLRKFARRHRALVGTVAVAMLALLAGAVTSTAFYLRAEEQRLETKAAQEEAAEEARRANAEAKRANEEAERARIEAETASQTLGFLTEMFRAENPYAGEPGRLSLPELGTLSPDRRRNLLRHACRELGLAAPPATALRRITGELTGARPDAGPAVCWPGGEARRYRDAVYLMPPLPEAPPAPDALLKPGVTFALGPGAGSLGLEAGRGIDPDLARAGLAVRYRAGGEKFRPAGTGRRRSLKKLLQEAGVLPWMRARIPLIYAGDALVAVGDLWLAEGSVHEKGYAPRWHDRPALTANSANA